MEGKKQKAKIPIPRDDTQNIGSLHENEIDMDIELTRKHHLSDVEEFYRHRNDPIRLSIQNFDEKLDADEEKAPVYIERNFFQQSAYWCYHRGLWCGGNTCFNLWKIGLILLTIWCVIAGLAVLGLHGWMSEPFAMTIFSIGVLILTCIGSAIAIYIVQRRGNVPYNEDNQDYVEVEFAEAPTVVG